MQPIKRQDQDAGVESAVSEQHKLRALPWCVVGGMLNTVFVLWTFAGSIFPLFLNQLGLPKQRIGGLLALFPLCGLLALGFAPWAARLGRKRVFLFGYGARKFVLLGLLGLPWISRIAGDVAAWRFLVLIVFLFAVLRALAETAYTPWSQEFVPNRVRGRFTAVSTVLGTLTSVVALWLAGWLLGRSDGVGRFLVLIGVGCVFGLTGVWFMRGIPGGDPIERTVGGERHWQNMRQAMRDSNFLYFLGGSGGMILGTMLMVSFLPLYVNQELGFNTSEVVRLDIAFMVGGASTSLLAGWLADRIGSRPILMPSAALTACLPLGWLLLREGLESTRMLATLLYFLYGVAANGMLIGSGRLVFNAVVPLEKNTAYTAILYAWAGITGGLGPMLAGAVLARMDGLSVKLGAWNFGGYSVLFLTATLIMLAGWKAYAKVRPDARFSTRSLIYGATERVLRRMLLTPGR